MSSIVFIVVVILVWFVAVCACIMMYMRRAHEAWVLYENEQAQQRPDREYRIKAIERYYNGSAHAINNIVQSFPSSLVARWCNCGVLSIM